MVKSQKRWQHGCWASLFPRSKEGNIPSIFHPSPQCSLQWLIVSFKTKRVLVPTRSNPPLNRLKKTLSEIPPPESSAHLSSAREAHLATKRKTANEKLSKQRKEEERKKKEQREEKLKRERDWEELYGEGRVREEGKTNIADEDGGGWDEDDFM